MQTSWTYSLVSGLTKPPRNPWCRLRNSMALFTTLRSLPARLIVHAVPSERISPPAYISIACLRLWRVYKLSVTTSRRSLELLRRILWCTHCRTHSAKSVVVITSFWSRFCSTGVSNLQKHDAYATDAGILLRLPQRLSVKLGEMPVSIPLARRILCQIWLA